MLTGPSNPARRRLANLLLVTAIAAGCSGSTNPVDDPPASEPGGGRIRLVEVATIGCETCPRAEQVSVHAMGMDPDGLIWAVDRYAPHMRVFQIDGELVAAFGPEGEGPGDFRKGPMNMMITGNALFTGGGGRALVYQLLPPAFVELDVDGNAIRHLPILVSDSLRQIFQVLVRDPTGPRAFALSSRVGNSIADNTAEEPFVIHRLDIDEEAVRRTQIASGREILPDADPAALQGLWFGMAIAPDGTLIIGDAHAYRFVRLDAEGNVIGGFSHTAERPLKSEVMLDAERRAARRRKESIEDIDIYDGHFRRRSLEFDDEGRLWVALNRPTREKTEFDVFAPDGTFLQKVEVPYHVQRYNIRGVDPAFVLTGGYLAAPVVGPDDEDRIKVWRVVEE